MSATIDCVYLAAIAQFKLSAQVAHPAPFLRLVVGHSNLLGSLRPELVDKGIWSLEMSGQPKPGEQRDSQANKPKFFENFDECSHDSGFDWDSSSDSDSYATSSSDGSSDAGAASEDDNSQHGELADATSQPRIPGIDDGATELSLLEDHLAHLQFLASQAGWGDDWSPAPGELGRHQPGDGPSIQAPVVLSSGKAMAEIPRGPSPFHHPGLFYLPPRNPARLATPGSLP